MQSTNATGSNLTSVTSVEVTSSEARTIRCLLEYSPSEAAFKRIRFTLQLKVLYQATEPMMPVEVGERVGMPASHAGPLLSRMLVRGLVEKPDKKRSAYRITKERQKYLDNPPPEPPEKMTKRGDKSDGVKIVEKTAEKVVEENAEKVDVKESEAGKKEDIAIPSQVDTFKSIAEQLGISKSEEAKGGSSLPGIINFVERTADMDDLDSLWNAGQPK